MSIISSIDKSEIFSAFAPPFNVKRKLFYCSLVVSSSILFPKFFCSFFLEFFGVFWFFQTISYTDQQPIF